MTIAPCAGRRNQEIADEPKIPEATVKAHMSAILRKLGAANRTQAALKMNLSRRGFVRINHPPTLRAFLPE